MKELLLRIVKIVFGLFLFAFGSYCTIQANIGLAPWDALNMGCMYVSGMSFGNVVVLIGVVILIVDFLLKEKIGVGTILNTLLIGKFIDLFRWIQILPKLENFFGGLLLLLIGQIVICIASYFYIGGGMGCGPRDSLMVALSKRMPKIPVGMIRGCIEATALLIGWLLGGKVGIGTVISVFGIGIIMQYTFQVLHFDVTGVQHESIGDTWKKYHPRRNATEEIQEFKTEPRDHKTKSVN